MYFSPLEQFTVIPLSNQFFITNIILYVILIVILVMLLFSLFTNLIHNSWTLLLETVIISLKKTVKEQSGNEIFLPLIMSLFSIILIGNLVSNVPYNFSIATSLFFSITLSFIVFLGVTFYGIYLHRLKFLSFFLPIGTPLLLIPILVLIELISYFCRSISLGVRAFANSVAGHTLINILSGFLLSFIKSGLLITILSLIPFTLFFALIGLEIAISFIQSYVFVVLTSSYIKDVTQLH